MKPTVFTTRQVELLQIIEGKVEGADDKLLMRKARLGTLRLDEIDDVLLLINGEYLMQGIKEDWEPNEYGEELSRLLGVINEPRLLCSDEELDEVRQAELRLDLPDEQIR